MKYRYLTFSFCLFVFLSCNSSQNPDKDPIKETSFAGPALDLAQANRLASLPLKCVLTEFPNKTGQVLSTASDLGTPADLHPAFYGCFDWHSSVHGHWSLVRLLSAFPELAHRDSIVQILQQNINARNIQGEVDYFNRAQEYSYERMYGWAWLLKLQEELDRWQTPEGRQMAEALQPLSDLIVSRYIAFLPKLNYPIRVGTHTNAAFGMSFAMDYALHAANDSLRHAIQTAAVRLYTADKSCPIGWEPDGFDFLSPCLEEAALMSRVLPATEFLDWIDEFLPSLNKKDFSLEVARVSDREDGHLVHLDGLNFSRAWVFYRLARIFPDKFGHLKALGDTHVHHSLPAITDGSYEGEHWLASFALYALSEQATR